jgi:hypothetical protein
MCCIYEQNKSKIAYEGNGETTLHSFGGANESFHTYLTAT